MTSFSELIHLDGSEITTNNQFWNIGERLPELRINEFGLIANTHPEIEVLKKRLVLINHTINCSNYQCQVELCGKIQTFIKSHFALCTARECNVSSCSSTQKLLEHQLNCKNNFCVLCSPRYNPGLTAMTHTPYYSPPYPRPVDLKVERPREQFLTRPEVTFPFPMQTVTIFQTSTSAQNPFASEDNPGVNNTGHCKNHGYKINLKGQRGRFNLTKFANCTCDNCNKSSGAPQSKIIKIEAKNEKSDTISDNGNIWKQFDAIIDEAALVCAGKDKNGHAVYVGRAYYGHQLLPVGLSIRNKSFVTTTFDGFKQKITIGDMLIETGYSWKKFDGVIPKNAVFGGLSSKRENFYIGKQFNEHGVVIVGTVTVSGVLHVPRSEKKVIQNEFYILVMDDEGKSSDSIAAVPRCSVCWEEAPIVGIFMDCGHACLCNSCIALINSRKNANGKVNCVICRHECSMARKIFFA